ncbi:hypothetical protein DXV76_09950 [Rhodobacteraceae bacterium CCMM004]|nr:hypothetical protein DXV76_09950 [Rhodobacteraceae bacterium CCMM004]
MPERYEETVAKIDYEGRVDLNLPAMALPLGAMLERKGFDFDVTGTVADAELQFISRSLIVTVLRDPENDARICVSAESPIGAGSSRELSRHRFKACAAAVRHFIFNLPAERVTWKHKGRTYITAAGKEITTEPTPVRRPTLAHVPHAVANRPHPGVSVSPDDLVFDIAQTERETRGDAPADLLDEIRSDFRAAEAAEEHGQGWVERIWDGDAAPERTVSEKLTVYTMNTILMVISLPVGLAVMAFNLLCGGSMKNTARALGLTGAAIGISASPSLALGGMVEALPPLTETLSAVTRSALPLAQSVLSMF